MHPPPAAAAADAAAPEALLAAAAAAAVFPPASMTGPRVSFPNLHGNTESEYVCGRMQSLCEAPQDLKPNLATLTPYSWKFTSSANATRNLQAMPCFKYMQCSQWLHMMLVSYV